MAMRCNYYAQQDRTRKEMQDPYQPSQVMQTPTTANHSSMASLQIFLYVKGKLMTKHLPGIDSKLA